MQRKRHPRTHASHALRPSTHEPGPVWKAVSIAVLGTMAFGLASHPALALALAGTVTGLTAVVGAGIAGFVAVLRLGAYVIRLRDRVGYGRVPVFADAEVGDIRK